jgi:mono/diheme cytochrome c family protein
VTAKVPSDMGAQLLQQKGCTRCHYTDRRDTKIGPGFKGLFGRERLPVSGWRANETNVRHQMLDPFENMPSFEEKLTEQEIDAIIAHLKTL